MILLVNEDNHLGHVSTHFSETIKPFFTIEDS